MKKRVAAIVFCLAVLLGICGKAGYDWWDNNTYIIIDGERIRRDVTALDYAGKPLTELEKIKELSCLEKLDIRNTGLTVQQYEELHAALPDCDILWQVPFQGNVLDSDTEFLPVTSLDETDVGMLPYFRQLQKLDVTGCENYALLEGLKASRPELDVHYTVRLGKRNYSCRTENLVLNNADPKQLAAVLPYLKNLTQVRFVGQTPDSEQIYQWKTAYPKITFVWNFTVCGISTDSLETQLILSDTPIDHIEEVESALKYFYNLERVEMCRCGIPSEELDALWKRNPEIRFVWEVQMGRCVVRTDATTFFPFRFGYDGNSVLRDSDMGEMKYCVDMICVDLGHMHISDYSFLNHMPNMQYLILADTRGTDFSPLANLKELKYVELFMTGFDQAEVLVGLTKLEDVNLGTTRITNLEPLKQMTWLKHLWLPENRSVQGPEKTALVEALPDTVVNFYGPGSTGHGWRNIPNYYAMRDLLGMPYTPGN